VLLLLLLLPLHTTALAGGREGEPRRSSIGGGNPHVHAFSESRMRHWRF
jgi:hypothetical protein